MFKRFLDLWRERNKTITVKKILKRMWHFFGVIRMLGQIEFLVLKGGSVGRLSVISKCKINGRKSNLIVGDFCSLVGVDISLHDSVVVENNVVVNPGVVILTASHSLSDPEWKHKKSPVTLKKYSWVATGSIILPGVTVGEGAVVGAGSVVREDVPDFSVVFGNPARVLDIKRSKILTYSPTDGVAQFEAWLK